MLRKRLILFAGRGMLRPQTKQVKQFMANQSLTDLVRSAGPSLIFAGNTLDRVDARREDSGWLAERLIDPVSRFLVLSELRPLMATEPALDIQYQDAAAVAAILNAGAQWILLGMEGDRACFALDVSGHEDVFIGEDSAAKFIDARSIAMQFATPDQDGGRAGLIALARSLIDWHARHGFCAVCGAPTRLAEAGYKRECPSCDAEHFPRTDPVVIMLATNGDKALMGRGPGWPDKMYSALAGFVEPGETIEEAVAREVFEETAVRVSEVTYHTTQPWPFPSSLMIGCHAVASSTEITIDGNELSDAQWFDKADLATAVEHAAKGGRLPGPKSAPVWVPGPMAIAHQLVKAWVEG